MNSLLFEMDSEIRRLNSSDVDEFRNLRLIALEKNSKIYLQIFEEEHVKPKTFHVGMLNDNVVVGVFVDNVLVGYTILTSMFATKLKHKAYMWGIYVDPKFRKFGLARAMQEWLFTKCSNFGIKTLHSTIVDGNSSAVLLHKSLGYSEVYSEKNGIKHYDGTYNDLIHMIKYL